MVETVTITEDPKKATPLPDLTKTNERFGSINDVIFYAGRVDEQEAKVKAEKKQLDLIRKFAVNAGIAIEDLDAVRKDLTEDPAVVQEREMRRAYYAKALGLKRGQLDLFADQAPAAPDPVDLAKERGFMLGLAGKNPDTQAYPENTPAGQAHLDGWGDGQHQLRQKFLQLNEKITETQGAAEREKSAKEAQAAARKAKREAKDKKAQDRIAKLAQREKAAKEKADAKAAKMAAKAQGKSNGGTKRRGASAAH